MTEDQAKTKWCPMVRSLTFNADGVCAANQAYKDGVVDMKLAMCKGSQCMMWRDEKAPIIGQDRTQQYGYCGLAGKP